MRPSAWVGPGSFLWLLRHDIRLGHRAMRQAGRRSERVALTVFGVIVVLLHLAGWVAAPGMAAMAGQFRAESLLAGMVALISVFALFLSKSISQATDTLHDRGDLDLLLSSPLPMRRVLTARLLAIAAIAAIMPMLLGFPFVNGMLLRGYTDWIGVYPVVVGFGLGAAALGSAMVFGLLALLGPGSAVVAARILATVFGMVALLVSQVQFIAPGMTSSATWGALGAEARAGAHGPLWWPTRALLGEPGPMLALLAAGIGAVLLVSRLLGRAYAQGVLGQLARPAAPVAWDETARHFGEGGWPTLLRKETRLLMRQPGLVANLAYQFVFLAPGVIMAQRVAEVLGRDAAPTVVLLTVMMTGRISRIVAAGPFGDDAAALARTSPCPQRLVLWAKLAVAAALLAVVLAISLLVVAVEVPHALLATAIAATGAALARLWIASGQELPLRRVGLHGRFNGDATAASGVLFDALCGLIGLGLALAL